MDTEDPRLKRRWTHRIGTAGQKFEVTREACRDTGQMAQCNALKQLRPKKTVGGAAVRCFDLETKPAVEIVDTLPLPPL